MQLLGCARGVKSRAALAVGTLRRLGQEELWARPSHSPLFDCSNSAAVTSPPTTADRSVSWEWPASSHVAVG